MPLYTADALILRTYKLAEADRIVVFLTRDRGKKRGVAKGARRSRSRFAGALEPLTRARVAYFEKERRELVSLNYAEVACSPLSAADAGALGHVSYFAELIDEWAPEADPNERLYRLGAAMTAALAAGVPVDPLARYFEYWVLRLQGVYPSHLVCHRCHGPLGVTPERSAMLAPGARVFTCRQCTPSGQNGTVGDTILSPEALGFLRAASTVSPDRVGELPRSERVLRELEAVHHTLIAMHLEKPLKSVRVLRDMNSPES